MLLELTILLMITIIFIENMDMTLCPIKFYCIVCKICQITPHNESIVCITIMMLVVMLFFKRDNSPRKK